MTVKPVFDAEALMGAAVVIMPERSPEVEIGVEYVVNDCGVYWLKETEEEGVKRIRLCARLDILASTRDGGGEAWGSLLRWKDADGREKQWAMPRSLLAGDGTAVIERLLDWGLDGIPVSPALRKRLLGYLNHSVPLRYWCESKIGWHPGGGFVLPNGTVGGGTEPVIFQARGNFPHAFNVAGTLEGWQSEIGRYCVGNSRAAFAVSAAFAASLLHLVDEENGGFHFRGTTSSGKTTTLQVAGSVWGGGRAGYLQRWKATGNALESVAEAHNDALLILDEIGQADPKEVGEIAYALGNGQGKLRGARQGGNRPTAHYRTLFLSAGEKSLREHAHDGGKRIKGGQEVRLADIPFLPDWEELHGFNGAGLSRQLKEASARYYGTPIRAFLEALVKLERSELLEGFKGFRESFRADYVPAGAPGEVTRVADRFALVAFAGETATGAGILPWTEGEAERAAASCFQAWFDGRDTKGASDIERGIREVRKFLQVHGAARFERLGDAADEGESLALPRTYDRAGFVRAVGGVAHYEILSTVFQDEVCKGFDYRAVVKALSARGYLDTGSEGMGSIQVRHPVMGKVRVYRVTPSILEEVSE